MSIQNLKLFIELIDKVMDDLDYMPYEKKKERIIGLQRILNKRIRNDYARMEMIKLLDRLQSRYKFNELSKRRI